MYVCIRKIPNCFEQFLEPPAAYLLLPPGLSFNFYHQLLSFQKMEINKVQNLHIW